MKQTESGKAFEYQLAYQLSKFLNVPFLDSPEKQLGLRSLKKAPELEQKRLIRSADEAATFLACHDDRFKLSEFISLQPDKAGQAGDVRDIVVTLTNKSQIGISTKNRHDAIKHSRLSDKIDFGEKWASYPCSSHYWKVVKPVFTEMRERRKNKELFRDIPDKANKYYLPILSAFEDELRRLTEDFGQRFVKRFFQYLLGTNDYYKVIKENGHVALQSFNLNGDLEWGKKWKVPDRIEAIQRKRNTNTTLLVTFVGGWQLSFRVHNADKIINPSLKFDVRFIGMPHTISRHEISYNVNDV